MQNCRKVLNTCWEGAKFTQLIVHQNENDFVRIWQFRMKWYFYNRNNFDCSLRTWTLVVPHLQCATNAAEHLGWHHSPPIDIVVIIRPTSPWEIISDHSCRFPPDFPLCPPITTYQSRILSCWDIHHHLYIVHQEFRCEPPRKTWQFPSWWNRSGHHCPGREVVRLVQSSVVLMLKCKWERTCRPCWDTFLFRMSPICRGRVLRCRSLRRTAYPFQILLICLGGKWAFT